MNPFLSYRRSFTFLGFPETPLFTQIFSWETFQAIFPVLLFGDSAYNLFMLKYPAASIFQQNIIAFPAMKILFSVIVFCSWYVLFRKKSKRPFTELFGIERWILNFLLIIYVFGDSRPDQESYDIYTNETPKISLLRFAVENLYKYFIFDFCQASLFIKLLYMFVNLQSLLVISNIEITCLLNVRMFAILIITLGLGCFTWRINKKKSNEKNEEGSMILRRVLSFLPEGVMLLDSEGKVCFSNNYLQNIFNHEALTNEVQMADEFRLIKLADPAIHLSGGAKVLNNVPSQESNQNSLSSSDKDKFFSKVQGFDNLESLLGFLMNDLDAIKALEKCVLTFQAKHQQRAGSHGNMGLEIKINLFYKNNSDKYFIILFRDTTERQRIISLENENDNYRNNLIASFSHELRTPLNATLAFLEQAIETTGISPEIRENLLKPALISGKFLLSIVNDILDYSQIILNKLELKNQSKNIVKTIEDCAELFKEKLHQKGLQLKLRIDQTIPNPILTDHQRISQILVNLLSNAIRFTIEGFIEIKLMRTPEGNILLSVKDTGTGMNQQVQEKLRKSLVEGEIKEKINQDSAGIGLGLFISNALAHLICPQGKAGLEFFSKKDKGTRFNLEIENRRQRENNLQVACPGFTEDDTEERCQLNKVLVSSYTLNFRHADELLHRFNMTEPRTVLIVDDEVFNIMVIENFCKALGIPTERAFNGKEAIDKIRARLSNNKLPFKMVFMDVNMPIMDGYEATIGIKKMLKNREIEGAVIVGVTAYVSQGMINKCYESGMTEVLNKPLSKEMVHSILRRYHIIK